MYPYVQEVFLYILVLMVKNLQPYQVLLVGVVFMVVWEVYKIQQFLLILVHHGTDMPVIIPVVAAVVQVHSHQWE